MSSRYGFSEDEMEVEPGLGYPRAYPKICRDRSLSPYSHGPPFTFTPYILQPQLVQREKELDQMFPIIDPHAKPTTKPRIFLGLLWKQLNHLGNAGFDPAMFRVDPYGNVLYYHADSASPLAWEIDHWFPCSRGGLTVPSNLRIIQWQVYRRKHNKLEILVPWWDLQLGISINQFLSIFAAANSDFRNRALSLLFQEGPYEEINDSQSIESHNFPQPFIEAKERHGLAPAAVVLTRKEAYDANPALRTLDFNRTSRPCAPPIIASRKSRHGNDGLKENENPDMVMNPYQAIVMARDSLKQREETMKMKMEIQKLDDEMGELKQVSEEEKRSIQDLELALIKSRRRAEKCRRVAEAQSSYRSMLEKMIRDAMHQSVVYKEQVRLNQAAAHSLMARLEAQKAICDSAEKELHKKFKQRDELENQIMRPDWEQAARKRSRMNDCLLEEERENGKLPFLPGTKLRSPMHKELRVLLEEEQRLSGEERLSQNNDEQGGREIVEEEDPNETPRIVVTRKRPVVTDDHIVGAESSNPTELDRVEKMYEFSQKLDFRKPGLREPEPEEDEESRKNRGKGNVERWLKMLLEDHGDQSNLQPESNEEKYPKKEIKVLRFPEPISEDNRQPIESEKAWGNTKADMNKVVEHRQPLSASRASSSRSPHNEEKGSMVARKSFGGKDSWETLEREKAWGKKKEEMNKVEHRRPLSAPRASISRSTHNDEKGSLVARKSIGGGKESCEKSVKGKELARSESARHFRPIPTSPSIILGMRKGVDCMRKKPLVIDDDSSDQENMAVNNRSLRSSIKTIKKVVKM